jgi:hypothetical protein
MCTSISGQIDTTGSAKGATGWFPLAKITVGYDHPAHLQDNHAILLDFVNHTLGSGARVAVELTADSARKLIDALTHTLAAGEAYEASVSA